MKQRNKRNNAHKITCILFIPSKVRSSFSLIMFLHLYFFVCSSFYIFHCHTISVTCMCTVTVKLLFAHCSRRHQTELGEPHGTSAKTEFQSKLSPTFNKAQLFISCSKLLLFLFFVFYPYQGVGNKLYGSIRF